MPKLIIAGSHEEKVDEPLILSLVPGNKSGEVTLRAKRGPNGTNFGVLTITSEGRVISHSYVGIETGLQLNSKQRVIVFES